MRGIRLAIASFILLLAASAPAAGLGPSGESPLATLEAEIATAIGGWTSEPDAAAQAEWRSEARGVIGLWTRFRDLRCDPDTPVPAPGIAAAASPPESEPCRAAFDRLIEEDLRWRYDLAGPSAARHALDPAADARPFRPHDPEAIECEPPPEPECDYCAINACWAAILARDESELGATWNAVLEATDRRPGLDEDERRAGAARLERTQQTWKALREADCRLQTWETPNRWGRANHAMIEAPCLHAETRARIAYLAAAYPQARAAFPARIPDAYRGLWSAGEGPCAQAGDALVRVSADGIAFAASFARLVSGFVEDGTFRFVADTEEEGEHDREEIGLALEGDRLLLARAGETRTLVRCAVQGAG